MKTKGLNEMTDSNTSEIETDPHEETAGGLADRVSKKLEGGASAVTVRYKSSGKVIGPITAGHHPADIMLMAMA